MSLLKRQLFAPNVSVWTLRRALNLYVFNRSPRAWLQAASSAFKKLSGYSLPHVAALVLTFRCQCKCAHCYAAVAGRDSQEEMSTAEFVSVIDQLKSIGTVQLTLTGGEPLLREDIFELVAYANRRGLLTRLSTNGLLLNRKVVAKLKRAGLNQCAVSIDEAEPENHDLSRGVSGTFERAVRGLHYLREYKIDRKIVTYTSREKINRGLEPIIKLSQELNVNSVYFIPLFISGHLMESNQESLSDKEMARLRSYKKYPFVELEFPSPNTKCSAVAKTFLSVNTLGEVTPCPAIPYVMGNVREEPLKDIWDRHVALFRLETKGECPMNDVQNREYFRAHAESVLALRRRRHEWSKMGL